MSGKLSLGVGVRGVGSLFCARSAFRYEKRSGAKLAAWGVKKCFLAGFFVLQNHAKNALCNGAARRGFVGASSGLRRGFVGFLDFGFHAFLAVSRVK